MLRVISKCDEACDDGLSWFWWLLMAAFLVCVLNIAVYVDLAETVAEPSLQATQLKLKRARLADDLNEKIAQRPGPMELVEKNILPVASSVKEAIIGKWIDHKGQRRLTFVCIRLGCIIIIYYVGIHQYHFWVHVFWYLVDTDTEMSNLLSVNQSGPSPNFLFSSVDVSLVYIVAIKKSTCVLGY